jgi:hypothetical protein
VARHGEFATALASVRGRVEIGVRATANGAAPASGTAPGAAAEGSGRAYLARKLEQRRAAARIGEHLHAELTAVASAATFRLAADPRPMFAGSYLVERDRVDEFRRAVEAAGAARPELAVACTGPWPPFSFTQPLEAA